MPLLLYVAGCLLQTAAAGCNKNKHCEDDEFCYSLQRPVGFAPDRPRGAATPATPGGAAPTPRRLV